jgi:hypothetical protein
MNTLVNDRQRIGALSLDDLADHMASVGVGSQNDQVARAEFLRRQTLAAGVISQSGGTFLVKPTTARSPPLGLQFCVPPPPNRNEPLLSTPNEMSLLVPRKTHDIGASKLCRDELRSPSPRER